MIGRSQYFRRPGERRDPYGADSMFRHGGSGFLFFHERQGLWVPAFAGMT